MNKIVARIGAAALSVAAASAAHATPARNVVLVHGAFTDQTSWNKVAQLLHKKGYHVILGSGLDQHQKAMTAASATAET